MRYLSGLLVVTFLGVATYAAEPQFTERQRSWWSLQPVVKPAVPAVPSSRNAIDAFVLASLTAKGLKPNPAADRVTLLRRVTIDLTGLTPTEDETRSFVNDKSPRAWETVVDRLLASPRYGERWARHWLDVARYADSNGFKADETRPNVWRYRDYVIDAFNSDKPYDRFVREQIAGDELYPGDPDALIAMGFNRHWIDETNAAGLFTRRQETLDDITNTTGAAFLGLTFGCARCHDHKYDPILHKDYYRLQAFFANTSFGDGPLPLKDPAARKEYEAKKAIYDEKTKDIRAEMNVILEPLRKTQLDSGSKTFEDEVKEALFMDASKRDPLQRMMYHTAAPRVAFDEEPGPRTLRGLKGNSAERYLELKKDLEKFDAIKPEPLPQGQFMIDIGVDAPPVFTLKNGNWQARGEEVQPGFLTILDAGNAKVTPLPALHSTGRRTALAGWLTDPSNPLVARVMVNRIWSHHFGRGIVSTPGDFGRQGAKPTNQALLDYLAASFVENGWSIKKLQKLILMSATFQESSDTQALAAQADPDNTLLWKFTRQRMDAEAIRDSALQTSGLLNVQMGGPGVFPPVPAGTLTELSATAVAGGWKTEKDPAQGNRRSIYIFVRRNLRYPMLMEFDNANTFESAHTRTNTVTPAQSLELLNSEVVSDWSRALAGRVLGENGSTNPEQQVARAFKLVYGREVSGEEQKTALTFLEDQRDVMGARLAIDKIKPPLPTAIPAGMDQARAAAFVDLCHMLLASNEFLYIN